MDGDFTLIGQPAARIAGRAKVTGRPPFASADAVWCTGGETTRTLETDRIWHDGPIIGIVVADTFEAAREAAFKASVSYVEEKPSATFDSPGVKVEQRDDSEHDDFAVGDAETAFAAAEVKIDA